MLHRFSRALILAAVAAVVSYAQCFGDCGGKTLEPEQTSQGSCHHKDQGQKLPAVCSHPHAEFASPEAGPVTQSAPLSAIAHVPWQQPLESPQEVLQEVLPAWPPGPPFARYVLSLRI